jgi:hypothetical protein
LNFPVSCFPICSTTDSLRIALTRQFSVLQEYNIMNSLTDVYLRFIYAKIE